MLLRSRVDERGHTHVRYAQMKNGLPVVGEELVVHVDESGRVYAANGSARDGEQVATKASLSEAAASRAALRATEGTGLAAESTRLVYYRPETEGPLALAYEVVVTGQAPDSPSATTSSSTRAMAPCSAAPRTSTPRSIARCTRPTTPPPCRERSSAARAERPRVTRTSMTTTRTWAPPTTATRRTSTATRMTTRARC
ncbi:hypothetical protein ACN28S_33510 [Cystobacter fuscus]